MNRRDAIKTLVVPALVGAGLAGGVDPATGEDRAAISVVDASRTKVLFLCRQDAFAEWDKSCMTEARRVIHDAFHDARLEPPTVIFTNGIKVVPVERGHEV